MKSGMGPQHGPRRTLAAMLIAAVTLLATALSACGGSGGRPGSAPAPGSDRVEQAVPSTAPDAGSVKVSYLRLHDPLPAEYPAHPEACDWIGYLRFRDAQGPDDARRADAILVAQAGVIGGAGSFDQIARHTVANAAARGKHIEFWALDRRSNCLEDHRGIEAAAAARDWRIAVDYYYGGKAIDGQGFAGFLTDAQVPVLAEFGLAQTMRDQYTVITRGLPDATQRKQKLFCGGHSLGGPLTAAFAAWDFDGDPATTDDAGYNQCAGYFILDTDATLPGAPLGPIEQAALDQLGGGTPDVIEAGIRSGALPRIFDIKLYYGPEILAFPGIMALAAYQQPDEVGLVQQLPHSTVLDLNLRYTFARDWINFLTDSPNVRDFKLTNAALFGGMLDDNTQPLAPDQISFGSYDGGPVVQKNFPTPGAVPAIPLPVAPSGGGRPLMSPATPNGPVYTWRNYDRIGAADAPEQLDDSGKPYTSPAQEVCDLREVARAFFEAPADYTTHYESLRLVLDFARAVAGDYSGSLRDLRYPDAINTRPQIRILAGDNTWAKQVSDPPPANVLILPGYTHIDVISAAAVQNDGQPERGAQFLADFVLFTLAHPGEAFPGMGVR